MMDDSIRPAVLADAEPIATLIDALGYPTSPDAMARRLGGILSDPKYATFVATSGDRVVGVAGAALGRYYEKDGLYSRLVVLAVSPEERGQGIGHRLLNAVERWSATNGVHEVFVNSGSHRAEAHRFYEESGYSRTGFRFVKQVAR